MNRLKTGAKPHFMTLRGYWGEAWEVQTPIESEHPDLDTGSATSSSVSRLTSPTTFEHRYKANNGTYENRRRSVHGREKFDARRCKYRAILLTYSCKGPVRLSPIVG